MAENETVKAVASEKSASEKKTVENKKPTEKKPNVFKRIGKFFKGCFAELKKVTWLNKHTTIKYTVLVIVALVVIAAVIGVFDYLCAWVINSLGGLY